MTTPELLKYETDERNLNEEISKLKQISLGEGAAACEACEEKLREGDALVALAVRPADQPGFEIGHVKCTDCRHEPTEHFTVGVRELVLDGRIGTCTDQATQSSWSVLLAPRPRAVSPADTTTVHPLPGTTWARHPITQSDVFTAADRATTRKPWQRAVVRADTADRTTTPAARPQTADATDIPATHTPDDQPGGAR